MRIQKYLSQQGICSRRKAEEFILKGWVMLNGEVVTQLGQVIAPDKDVVELTKDAQQELALFQYLLVNKPRGIVTHSPQDGERDIKSILPVQYRHLFPIGRLDKESEGLILLTNDGVFSKKMLDSINPHERLYHIKVNKPLTDIMMRQIRQGVYIGDYKTKPCDIIQLAPLRYQMTLFEGKNRQIRRMIQRVGSFVTALKRVSFGLFELNHLNGELYKEISPLDYDDGGLK